MKTKIQIPPNVDTRLEMFSKYSVLILIISGLKKAKYWGCGNIT